MSNLCRYVIAACRNGYIIERGDWTCKGILCSLYYKMGWVWDLRLVQGLYLGLIGLAGGGTVEIKVSYIFFCKLGYIIDCKSNNKGIFFTR